MKDYTTTEFLKLCKENIPEMEVMDVAISEDVYTVRFKKKRTIADYIKEYSPKTLIFISGDDAYKVYKFYVNTGDGIRTIYVLKNGDKIIDVICLYEFLNYEKFTTNKFLTLPIDKILVKE